jgi:Spy/CpxP family protein refolding chaperone
MQRVRIGWIGAAVALMITLSVAAIAQGEPGQGGGRRFGRQGGRGMMLAQIPVAALDAELKLNADQKTKIAAIHDRFEADTKNLRPQPGTQPEPANFQKLRELSQQANQEIQAVLTEPQKAKLPAVTRNLMMLRTVGIPIQIYGDLKLTEAQKQQIQTIARETQEKRRGLSADERREKGRELRQEAQSKVSALLTASQKTTIANYEKAHPRGRGGRRGGQNNNNAL